MKIVHCENRNISSRFHCHESCCLQGRSPTVVTALIPSSVLLFLTPKGFLSPVQRVKTIAPPIFTIPSSDFSTSEVWNCGDFSCLRIVYWVTHHMSVRYRTCLWVAPFESSGSRIHCHGHYVRHHLDLTLCSARLLRGCGLRVSRRLLQYQQPFHCGQSSYSFPAGENIWKLLILGCPSPEAGMLYSRNFCRKLKGVINTNMK